MASRKPAPGKGRVSKGSPKSGRTRKRASQGGGGWLLRGLGAAGIAIGFAFGLGLAQWVLEIDRVVVERFEGRRFSVPSRVYSAPLIVYPGTDWQRVDLSGWLLRLGYRQQPEGGQLLPGRYEWLPGRLAAHLAEDSYC